MRNCGIKALPDQNEKTVADPERASVTMVWGYIAELIFNMLVLEGAVKMADREVREMIGYTRVFFR